MLQLLLLAAAAADPAVTVAPATTDRVVNWAIQAPLTVAFFLLLGAIGYIGRWVIRDAFPKWLDEQEKSRQLRVDENEKTRLHFEKLADKRGAEAAQDVASAHAAIGERVEAMHADVSGRVDDVSGKLDAAHNKLDAVHAVVRALASKQGLGVVLVLLALSGAAVATASKLYRTASYTCSPSCAAPSWCCKTNVCCRNASTATASCPQPHSDRVVAADYGDEPWAEIDGLRITSL